MNKTINELRSFLDNLNMPKIGEVVTVVDDVAKKYVKATVIAEVPTGEKEMAKFKLIRKVGDKKLTFNRDISAIHAECLAGQVAR